MKLKLSNNGIAWAGSARQLVDIFKSWDVIDKAAVKHGKAKMLLVDYLGILWLSTQCPQVIASLSTGIKSKESLDSMRVKGIFVS